MMVDSAVVKYKIDGISFPWRFDALWEHFSGKHGHH